MEIYIEKYHDDIVDAMKHGESSITKQEGDLKIDIELEYDNATESKTIYSRTDPYELPIHEIEWDFHHIKAEVIVSQVVRISDYNETETY